MTPEQIKTSQAYSLGLNLAITRLGNALVTNRMKETYFYGLVSHIGFSLYAGDLENVETNLSHLSSNWKK
jgi:hypothetical protein